MNRTISHSRRPISDCPEDGKRFTEVLLEENEQLRFVIARVKTRNRDLEGQIGMTDTPRLAQKLQLMERENRTLREEVQRLKEHFNGVQNENQQFVERYVEVERQNSDLISLYVASYQLHSTLDFDEVVSAVQEIVVNLIGTEEFGIYLSSNDQQTLHPIAVEGSRQLFPKNVAFGCGHIGQTAQSGQVYLENNLQGGKRNPDGSPVICIPLKIAEKVTGVIAIYSLLVQKNGLDSLDMELFDLLGAHAGSALYASGLHAAAERARDSQDRAVGPMNGSMPESA